jgi:hypothetical protein
MITMVKRYHLSWMDSHSKVCNKFSQLPSNNSQSMAEGTFLPLLSYLHH